jgi:hypothetical protein
MIRAEFIETLKEHAKTAGIFNGRFINISDDENHWKYERPAVDALEPSIDLSTEGFVLFSPNVGFSDNTIEKISYEDFITKYNLTRK